MPTDQHRARAAGAPRRAAAAPSHPPALSADTPPAAPAPARRGGATLDERRITGLARAARSGAPDAAEEFVRATRADVWRFIAHLSDPQTADDLTQETFMRALRSLAGFAERSSARAWLMAIARRTVADHYRALAARPRPARSDGSEGAADTARTHRPSFEEELALGDLLHSLPEPRRTAFLLTQVQGCSYAAAARATGVPVGTVRSRVARARSDLIAALDLAESDSRHGCSGRLPAAGAAPGGRPVEQRV